MMRYKRECGKAGIDRIKEINDAWQTRGRETETGDFVNMQQAIYQTEQPNNEYHLEPRERSDQMKMSYVDGPSAFCPDVPPLPPPCAALDALKAFCEEPGRESDCGGGPV